MNAGSVYSTININESLMHLQPTGGKPVEFSWQLFLIKLPLLEDVDAFPFAL